MRAWSLAVALAALLVTPLAAQRPTPEAERPWYVGVSRYGKWATLATAAGLVTLAAVWNADAADAERALTGFCEADPFACRLLSADGGERYTSDEAERLFQEFARLEKKSRGSLIGGQLAIVATGSMFLVDLLYRDERPKNIPYTPLQIHSSPGRLGLSMQF